MVAERKFFTAPRDEHRRLLHAFLDASAAGDVRQLVELLAEDAMLVADGGPGGVRYGRVRNLPRPLVGQTKVAAFLAAVGRQAPSDVKHVSAS